jgi:DNA-binding protein H-NS
MKNLLVLFFITFSHMVLASEPQLKYITIKHHYKKNTEKLAKYEINNSELVSLYGFNAEKKQIKKKTNASNKIYYARNLNPKNFLFL